MLSIELIHRILLINQRQLIRQAHRPPAESRPYYDWIMHLLGQMRRWR